MNTLLPQIVKLAKEAGAAILAIYQCPDKIEVHLKDDQSPLTEADLTAHKIIMMGLQTLTPAYPILSEESPPVSFAERANWQRYWLVDPLDGTKEFIHRTDDFTVNIALIENHCPILGVVLAPALQLCYFAAIGVGAFKQIAEKQPHSLSTRSFDPEKVVIVTSRRHNLESNKDFYGRFNKPTVIHRGSALKCCIVAEGKADIYPRFGPTSEWDIAAGQCVLEQAGGRIVDLAGNPLIYNSKESLENSSFLAVGDSNYPWQKCV